MSSKTNKLIARRVESEIESQGNLALLDELCTPDFVLNFPGFSALNGEGYKQLLRAFHAGFSDLRITVEAQVAEGELVANRLRITGTHDGNFQGIPATGRPVDIVAMNMMQLVDGRLSEMWGQPDLMGLMQQLGVIPAAA